MSGPGPAGAIAPEERLRVGVAGHGAAAPHAIEHRGAGTRENRVEQLRPLGDVVVLMPILTSSPEDIDRIADTLIASIHAVV